MDKEILWAVLFIFLCAGLGAGMLVALRLATWWLGTSKRKAGKFEPYECGVPLLGEARERFGLRFYLVALLFVLFDIEILFLLPYAVAYKSLGEASFWAMASFVGVLGGGLAYLIARGALNWE